jgi:hypothetical protein
VDNLKLTLDVMFIFKDAEVKMKSKEGEQYVSHIIDWFSERLEIFRSQWRKSCI